MWNRFTTCLISALLFLKNALWGGGGGRGYGRQIVINIALLTTKFRFSSGKSACGRRKG